MAPSQLVVASCWTANLPCKMNPALLSVGHFLFFTPQQMVKHIHTHSLTLTLQPPEEQARLLSQLFLNFSLPLLLIYRPLPHTPTAQTSKWLLFRPYPNRREAFSRTKLAKNISRLLRKENNTDETSFLCCLSNLPIGFIF